MAKNSERLFPRFLFSNPKNTQSPGPFVIHCLEPRLIFQVKTNKPAKQEINALKYAPPLSLKYSLILLDDIDPIPIIPLVKRAEIWLNRQVSSGEITIS